MPALAATLGCESTLARCAASFCCYAMVMSCSRHPLRNVQVAELAAHADGEAAAHVSAFAGVALIRYHELFASPVVSFSCAPLCRVSSWGYKILFLDVLFPLDVERVIFVDADQIVRSDLGELWHMDLEGAPYGFTPFCTSREDTLGYQFWCGLFGSAYYKCESSTYSLPWLFLAGELVSGRNTSEPGPTTFLLFSSSILLRSGGERSWSAHREREVVDSPLCSRSLTDLPWEIASVLSTIISAAIPILCRISTKTCQTMPKRWSQSFLFLKNGCGANHGAAVRL